MPFHFNSIFSCNKASGILRYSAPQQQHCLRCALYNVSEFAHDSLEYTRSLCWVIISIEFWGQVFFDYSFFTPLARIGPGRKILSISFLRSKVLLVIQANRRQAAHDLVLPCCLGIPLLRRPTHRPSQIFLTGAFLSMRRTYPSQRRIYLSNPAEFSHICWSSFKFLRHKIGRTE